MSNYHVLNLSKYTAPDVEEVRNKEWVEYRIKSNKDYNYPNGYYQYLIDRAEGSVTNGSIIGGFSRFIYGEGLTSNTASVEQFVEIKSLLKGTELKKACYDRKKLMMAALQVTKNKGRVTDVTHFPMKCLLPEKMNEDGDIEAWYYHPDWKKKKSSEPPTRIPAFGFGGASGNEIYIIKAYNCASDYFGKDDGYAAGLAYAVLEEEIGDFQINDAQNGFTPTTIINFNNGKPENEEVEEKIVRDVYKKTTGSGGKKVIIAFNEDETKKATADKIAMDDAPDHYSYLSTECVDKILSAHRAPSELLGFNNDSAGFANNAEELKNKFTSFVNFEVQPFQMEFIDALEEIFALNDISIPIYFKQLTPFEFGEVTEEAPDPTTLSKEESLLEGFINAFGEDCPENWELYNECEVDYDLEDERDQELAQLNAPVKLKWWQTLISSGKAQPNRKSSQDAVIDGDSYRVRYKYIGDTTEKTRPFCRLMVNANKLYRKEDIIRMENLSVNPGWGPGGANTYSIWKYKGGGNCHHKWLRQTFKVAGGTGSTVRGDQISTNQARKEGYRPTNEKEVSMKPKDMPNDGFLTPRR